MKQTKARALYVKQWRAAHKKQEAAYSSKWYHKKVEDRCLIDKGYRERRERLAAYKAELSTGVAAPVRCVECEKTLDNSVLREKKTRRQSLSPVSRFNNYKHNSLARKISFELTFKQFMIFWRRPCDYCDDAIETIGLDRINNNLGYTQDNVVACCGPCNYSKKSATKEQYIARCIRVAKKFGGGL